MGSQFSAQQSMLLSIKSVLAIQMMAIREGLLWILPCLMMSSLILFAASIGEFTVGKDVYWVETLYGLYYRINSIFPILLTAALSYILAMQWRLPRPPIALISIVYLTLFRQPFEDAQSIITFELIVAVITPLYTIPLIAYFYRQAHLKIIRTDQVGKTVKDSLNLIVPSLFTEVVVVAVSWFFVNVLTQLLVFGDLDALYAQSPQWFGYLYTLLNSLLWFIGIHGYYALLPWIEVLQQAVPSGVEAAQSNEIVNHSMMAVFVFIGGCGATLGLVLSILCFSTDSTYRLIAIAALPLVMLNINEVLLFGLPIIFNPRLFIPFVLAPMVNLAIAYMVLAAGWVSIPSVIVPFSSPVLLNSWLVTQGDMNAVWLQLCLVVIGAAIYTPFVFKINNLRRAQSIPFPFFDSSYTRRREEADVLSADKVSEKVSTQKQESELEKGLERYSQIDFCLEYQPQVQQKTGKVVACEALIRAKDPATGRLIYPGDFLPYFEQAKMMGDIDLWAVKKVVSDLELSIHQGSALKTSVNITPETLLNADLISRICRYIKPVGDWVNIEITEESLLGDRAQVAHSLSELRSLGCKISIDDFGVGYSSLSYLGQFDVDAIKIDRNFVLSLDDPKGKKVFYAMLKVAKELELDCVVEGVETQKQLDLIPQASSISVQGWYYSKSISREALGEYVQSVNVKPELTLSNA
ncbi:EAL domain-containing protein [Vibrio makurazakiensis]|uniref:EAL domain-containing protein n=1 Tax=Vibrio makurazakiensis TaxID=2910250 RepID=UPI003D1132B8